MVTEILDLSHPGSIVMLQGGWGSGRSTILRAVQRQMGGRLLTAGDYVKLHLGDTNPFRFQEVLFEFLTKELEQYRTILLDDFDLVLDYIGDSTSLREDLIHLVLRAIAGQVEVCGYRMVFAAQGPFDCPNLSRRCLSVSISALTREDQEFLFQSLLGPERTRKVDFRDIHSGHLRLSCRDIGLTCHALDAKQNEDLTTQDLLTTLERLDLKSNVSRGEIEEVGWEDLKGLEKQLEELRTQVLLPMQNTQLAREMELRPKRGVVLFGPPGVGKTSVGRALARELGDGKFFLLDGDISARSGISERSIRNVFSASVENSPSVLFVDDADVLLKYADREGENVLYRALLSHLDGIRSKETRNTCVILTAMEVSHLPPALIRSGRLELWLEITLPDAKARLEILQARCGKLLGRFPDLDLGRVAEATEGLTGSDLRRIVEDCKNQIAFRLLQADSCPEVTKEFLKAAKELQAMKSRHRQGPEVERAGFRGSGR